MPRTASNSTPALHPYITLLVLTVLMTADDQATIAHLLRRTGFGPTSAEVDAAASKGYPAMVEELLDFTGPDPADATPPPTFTTAPRLGARNLSVQQRQAIARQRAVEFRNLQQWWLARMGTTAHPLKEKLTWFWHTHFATSEDKVQWPALMYRQNQLFRTMGTATSRCSPRPSPRTRPC